MRNATSFVNLIIGITGLLGIVFVVLKLFGVIDWSWWWVTSPLWWQIPPVAIFSISSGIFRDLNDNNISNKTRFSYVFAGVMGLSTLLFVALKLFGVLTWSWWWVTLPLWGGVLFLMVVALIGTIIDHINYNR